MNGFNCLELLKVPLELKVILDKDLRRVLFFRFVN